MAFSHFHRHAPKYLACALVATVFSLFAFNITSALTSFAAKTFGGSGGAHFVFQTRSGRTVGIEVMEWEAANQELPRAVSVYQTFVEPFDVYSGADPRGSDLTLAHFILLAEAEECGIVVPEEHVDALVHTVKQRLQASNPEVELKTSHWATWLGQTVRLGESSLRRRFREIAAVEAYVRAMRGIRVHDPVRVEQLFAGRNVEVGLDWVEIPYDAVAEELRAAPPPDSELEAWFAALPEATIDQEYSRDERYTIDLVLVDADAFSIESVPEELRPVEPEPTDDEILDAVRKDPTRYAGGGEPPAAAADLTEEARAKVKKDRLLRGLLDRVRRDFDAAAADLPAVDATKPEAERAADAAARVAEEKALFAQTAAKFGLSVQTIEDREQKTLAEIDPPKDVALQFIVRGLTPGGQSPAGLRTQAVLPARERSHAYVVRVVEAPKPRERKPFSEVKEAVLAKWIEEHSKERAVERAQALVDAVVSAAETALGEAAAVFREERDAELARIETLADLDEENRESLRKQARDEHRRNVAAALGGPAFGAGFAAQAAAMGLEVKSAGPHRRGIATTPYYNDRFSGAERFLFRQSSGGAEPALLSSGEGMVSGVFQDDQGKAAYVARVASRRVPKVEEMSPSDLTRAEEDEKFEWMRQDNPMFGRMSKRPSYEDRFSIAALVELHQPRFRVRTEAEQAPTGTYY